MSEELKPCPFCGKNAAVNTTRTSCKETVALNGQDTFYGVNCISCGTNNAGLLGHLSPEKAIAAWNTRAQLSAVPELMEALELGVETLHKASRELTTEHRSFLRGKVWGKPAIDKMTEALAKYKGEK